MSASREKKTRQDLAGSGWSDPKTAREAQQRKEEQRSNLLYGLIAVAFVVVLVVCLVWRSNVIPRVLTAATIDGEAYKATEVSYYYRMAYNDFLQTYSYSLSSIGLNLNRDPKGQTVSEEGASIVTDATVGQDWNDYFIGKALEEMSTVQGILKEAEDSDFTYPESVQVQWEEAMSTIRSNAAASGMSVNQYLTSSLGCDMTENVYSEQTLRMLQYSAYCQAYEDGLSYTDQEIEDAYRADTQTYDNISYELVFVDGRPEAATDEEGNAIEPTEEEIAAATAAAKETADQIYADWQSGEDLDLQALAEKHDKANYSKNESAAYYGGDLMDWLFDDSRTSGDSTVLENQGSYYVAVFRDRFRDEAKTIDVRHILFQIDSSGLDTESDTYEADLQALKDKAKAKAEDMLAQWQAGEATEDSFAKLAMENSEDSGSRFNGGLYTQVHEGQMVTEFNNWCFDPARKPGDTGVVYGEAVGGYMGYHVMYYVGDDMPVWQSNVTSNMKSEDYNAWHDAFAKDAAKETKFAIRYAG